MRSRLLAALFALGLVAPVVAGPGAVDAQVPDPVEEARQDRDQAEAVLDSAESRSASAAAASRRATGRLEQVGADLTGAVRRYREVNADLEEVTYRIAGLRETITEREARVRELRAATRDYVVRAYMAGGTDGSAWIFSVDSYTELVTSRAVLNRTSELNAAMVGDLTAASRELGALHDEFDGDQALLRSLQADAARVVTALDDLFARAGDDAGTAATELDAARRAVADADAEYQAAVLRLDEEIEKRRLVSAGVEKWRPLVERYFPPEQVWQAMAVMSCESSGVATATHEVSGAAGLFQFMAGTWGFASAEAGFAGFSRHDPEANIASAAWLVDYSIRTNHPWGPWGRWSCRTVLH